MLDNINKQVFQYMPKQNKTHKFTQIIILIERAAFNIGQQLYKRANKILHRVLKIQPNYANAYYLLSICQKQLGMIQQHHISLRQAYRLNPVFYENQKNNEKQIVKKIVSLFNSSKIVQTDFNVVEGQEWGQLVNTFFNAKDLHTCYLIMQLYQQLQLQNQNKTSYQFSTMGIAYYQYGLYKQSLRKYEQAISIKNQIYFYYNNCAIIKYVHQDYQAGLEFINKSLSIKPNYPRTFFIQSFCFTKLGMLDRAMDRLTQVINQCPTSVHYRLKRVTNLLLYFKNRSNQVKTDINQIISIINEDQDSDSYFVCSSNLPTIRQSSNFILKYIDNQHVQRKDWNLYINCLDDYLIKGHTDKYRLSKQMTEIKQQIEKYIKNNEKEKNMEDMEIV